MIDWIEFYEPEYFTYLDKGEVTEIITFVLPSEQYTGRVLLSATPTVK